MGSAPVKPPAPNTAKPTVRKPREKDIEKKGNDYAKSRGWLVRKFVSPGNNGVPDRLYFREGKCVLVEWKAERGKTSKAQDMQINALRKAGMEVYVCDSADSVLMSMIFD